MKLEKVFISGILILSSCKFIVLPADIKQISQASADIRVRRAGVGIALGVAVEVGQAKIVTAFQYEIAYTCTQLHTHTANQTVIEFILGHLAVGGV